MKKKVFRTVAEMAEDEKEQTVPVSGRVRVGVRDFLTMVAEEEGKSLSWLVRKVLEDYAQFVGEYYEPGKKR